MPLARDCLHRPGVINVAISGILVPLDGAGIAASVLPTVASLARPIRAAVHLTAVVDLKTLEIPEHYYPSNPDTQVSLDSAAQESAPLNPNDTRITAAYTQHRVERARDYLGALASRLQALDIETSYEALVGDPMTDIVDLARRKRFGLIALSPHSRYAIGRGLGSVTDRVLHSSPIPILVAPPLSDPQPSASEIATGTVIATLDGSKAAESALEPASQIARATGAQLVLLRSTGGRARERAWGEGAHRVGRDIEADFRREVGVYMDRVADRLEIPCTTMIGGEDEVTEILDALNSLPTSIAVMASQGQAGLTKWRLGSITDRIIRQTSRPIIVVPPRSSTQH